MRLGGAEITNKIRNGTEEVGNNPDNEITLKEKTLTPPSPLHTTSLTLIACDVYAFVNVLDSTSRMEICPISEERAMRRPSGLW